MSCDSYEKRQVLSTDHHASRYWQQRYDIWQYYDDGIWMTDSAWFGITPEPVATYVLLASHQLKCSPN